MRDAMPYEFFIRHAFSIDKGERVGRRCDPAALANADVFRSDQINRVKAGIAYSMEIFTYHIIEHVEESRSEWNDMKSYTGKVIEASSLDEIDDLLTDYSEKFVKKYIRPLPRPFGS